MSRISFLLLISLPRFYPATVNRTVGNDPEIIQIIYGPNGPQFIFQPASPTSVPGSNCDPNPPPPDKSQDRFTPPEIIHAAGFPNETHQVITSDGYILTAHRIRKDGGMPVLILHGIFSSSRDFLMHRGSNALAFQLWLAGYDVWLGNMRGTPYSLDHTTIQDPLNDPLFWDFSWDQMAQKDVPAFIDYVLAATERTEMQCVGYSLGTTAIIAGLIRLPEYRQKCKCFTGLAPVTYNGNITAIAFKAAAAFTLPEEPLRSVLFSAKPSGRLNENALSDMVQLYAPEVCELDALGVCMDLIYLLFGLPNPEQVDPEMQTKIYTELPASTSIRTYIQVESLIFYQREFREYVFQTEDENIQRYGAPISPVYNLGDFNVPSTLYVGLADAVATVNDVNAWAPMLGTKADIIFVDNPKWAHLDFLFAKDACEILYAPVIRNLETCASP